MHYCMSLSLNLTFTQKKNCILRHAWVSQKKTACIIYIQPHSIVGNHILHVKHKAPIEISESNKYSQLMYGSSTSLVLAFSLIFISASPIVSFHIPVRISFKLILVYICSQDSRGLEESILKVEYSTPGYLTSFAQSLIGKLLQYEPMDRHCLEVGQFIIWVSIL